MKQRHHRHYKDAGAQWKGLSGDEKKPYDERYAENMEDYQVAKEKLRNRNADKDAKPKKDKDAPKKPIGGGYGVFLSENREKIVKSLPEGSNIFTDTTKTASAQWKALSGDEKKLYQERYAEKMKEYQVAKEEYSKAQTAKEEASLPAKQAKWPVGEPNDEREETAVAAGA